MVKHRVHVLSLFSGDKTEYHKGGIRTSALGVIAPDNLTTLIYIAFSIKRNFENEARFG